MALATRGLGRPRASTAQRSAAQPRATGFLRAVARVIVLINLPYLPYSGRLVCALQATIFYRTDRAGTGSGSERICSIAHRGRAGKAGRQAGQALRPHKLDASAGLGTLCDK